jgi:hypothetical protein
MRGNGARKALSMRDRTTMGNSAEAGAPEVEITPAMIEAGVSVLCAAEPLFNSDAAIVRRIFSAMLSPLGMRVLDGGLGGDPV